MPTKRKIREESAAESGEAAAIECARADADAGKTVAYEKVRRWLLSWGTRKDLPRPRCK